MHRRRRECRTQLCVFRIYKSDACRGTLSGRIPMGAQRRGAFIRRPGPSRAVRSKARQSVALSIRSYIRRSVLAFIAGTAVSTPGALIPVAEFRLANVITIFALYAHRSDRRGRRRGDYPSHGARATQGSSILPLYLPPKSVSVRASYMYVPSPRMPSNLPVPPVFLYVYSLRWEPSSQLS